MPHQKTSSNHLAALDILRIVAFLFIFIHHLNFFDGGYVAISIFFMLSGYLSFISASHNHHFSWKSYYWSRLKRLYLPMALAVIIICLFTLIFPSPIYTITTNELASLFTGTYNIWELHDLSLPLQSAVGSPFLNFWYLSALLQLELIFPFLYLGYQKLATSFKKQGTTLFLLLLCIAVFFSSIYYFYGSSTRFFSCIYLETFAWVPAWLIGIILAILHSQERTLTLKFVRTQRRTLLVLFSYLALLVCASLYCRIDNYGLLIFVPLTAIITFRIIDYAKFLHFPPSRSLEIIASLTFPLYLFHYPLMTLVGNANLPTSLEVFTIFVFLIVLSFFTYRFTTKFSSSRQTNRTKKVRA